MGNLHQPVDSVFLCLNWWAGEGGTVEACQLCTERPKHEQIITYQKYFHGSTSCLQIRVEKLVTYLQNTEMIKKERAQMNFCVWIEMKFKNLS